MIELQKKKKKSLRAKTVIKPDVSLSTGISSKGKTSIEKKDDTSQTKLYIKRNVNHQSASINELGIKPLLDASDGTTTKNKKNKKKKKATGITKESSDNIENLQSMNVIEDLFGELKRAKKEKQQQQIKQIEEDRKSIKSESREGKQQSDKKASNRLKFLRTILSPEAPIERIDKETGYPVYKAHLLKVGEGGGTPLCPFDCDCCF